MKDSEIVDLYWQRSENAIEESNVKYGSYCRKIAWNICQNNEDSEECVNDTWYKAWNIMPPKRPAALSSLFGGITRNLALSRWRQKKSQKRGGGEMGLVLEELEGCIPGGTEPEKELEFRELMEKIGDFVHRLKPDDRKIFLARYYYAAPIGEIAKRQGASLTKTKKRLYRMRDSLRKELEEL